MGKKTRSLKIAIVVNSQECQALSTIIDTCYIHQLSALGDSSTTRYGVNNIFQRDARTYARTHVRTPSQLGVSAPLEQFFLT